MAKWEQLIEWEPRLQHLKVSAMAAVLGGGNPDEVYVAVKPFVGFLVGGARGVSPLIADGRRLWHAWDGPFKDVLRMDPVPIFDYQEMELKEQANRDIAVSEIYDALCDADDTRREAA